MATTTMSRDANTSVPTHSGNVSSSTALQTPDDAEGMKKSNGYVSSPLRSSQRVSSVVTDKDLPDVPKHDPSSANQSSITNGVRQNGSSFPFNAQPGTSGPTPTTSDLANGHIEKDATSPQRQGKKRQNVSGTATPPEGRRSVQFARDTGGSDEPAPLAKTTTWETEEEGEEAEAPANQRQSSFFGKLKALASSSSASHIRNPSSGTGSATPTAALSPQSERSEPTYPIEPSEDADADIEEDTEEEDEGEGNETASSKKRRKSKRPAMHNSESAPPTPRSRLETRFASFMRDQSSTHDGKASSPRPGILNRRTTANTTTSDSSDHGRAGLSEDEGRDKIRNAWRRGIEGARGLSYARNTKENESPDTRRPSHIRRITGIGAVMDGTSSGSPFRTREKLGERQTTTSAQKWRQVKAGLKMLGQRKREERMRVDHQKSAQLMAELIAGAPAALVLGSMFQRDEHNHRKIPVLLEQLKIRIPESYIREGKSDDPNDRHMIFKIDLEYGNGSARMQWTISRSLKDFVNLHAKYQAQITADKVRHLSRDKSRAKMPRFPKSAFPYGRNIRGLFDNLKQEDDEDDVPTTPGTALNDAFADTPVTPGPMATPLVPGGDRCDFPPPVTPGVGPTGTGAAAKHRRRSSAFSPAAPRRTSTGGEGGALPTDPDEMGERQRELYNRRQRRKLENYLQSMIRWLIFRPDSTRLCKFLELSALAIRLSAEGGYQGKQGLLTIASRRNKELRRKPLGAQGLADRHRAKWFMVRHSYVVCTEGPESLDPYDVFLVDSEFRTEKKKKERGSEPKSAQEVAKAMADKAAEVQKSHGKHLMLRLYNAERKLKLLARTERQYMQFQESFNIMAQATVWSNKQRFASYAPVRNNVWCRWLVDGRDHMWQVSRAIDNARDFVYIHDWWLSPELYMRRPPAISQKWRLDRLLQRKAQEGVKIFVIVYRNIESAIPIDSEYTKWSLLDLHENICIQRSPNQFRQNQFFWAHHEKICVVDNMMAFVGGIDLCFGRWDEPCHTLTDDKLTGFEIDHVGPRTSETCQMWPGKDYSNPRVQDFYALDRPYEEMYDRTKVPRTPWHDCSMQIVGQPARDLGRHFVQRWNYILRSRIPSRPTPVLLPPPEYEQLELEQLGMTGSCQVQILRSCGPWSIGTPNMVEHSIMNAYVHLIEHSQHFVYIENQFYVSSCTVEGTTIHNKIGDALVERIIRAHDNDEAWQACLLIPLMPGFQNSVDSQDGTSIRLIMQCQYRSICRGETSIFGRLRNRGIEPEDYIRVYGLRQWGRIGPKKVLTTEQLYIHAKLMVVDDRSAIIGSANINERSMLGNRDSEVAAVVTDTRMIPSYMGGEPYEVSEFAHSLRMRLMREHLGIDVDAVYRRDQAVRERELQDAEMARIYRDETEGDYFSAPTIASPSMTAKRNTDIESSANESSGLAGTTTTGSVLSLEKAHTSKKGNMELQRDLDVEGYGFDNMKAIADGGDTGLTDSFVDTHGHEVLLKKGVPDMQRIRSMEENEVRRSQDREKAEIPPPVKPPYPTERMDTYALGLPVRSQLPDLPASDDTDIGGPPLTTHTSGGSGKKFVNPLFRTLHRPDVDENCMADPLVSSFFHDIWHQVAENNTKLYRQVFRCMPDSEVLDWKTYERFNDYNERFMQSQGLGESKPNPPKDAPGKSGPPGSAATEVGSVSSVVVEGRARSKSVLSGWVDKLRPGSRTSDEVSHTQEANEKVANEKSQANQNDEPGDSPSSGPTAVPSPQPGPLDEKEAQKLADQIDQQDHVLQPVAEEKQEKTEEPAAVGRRATVQYSEQINSAPETTATQSVPNANVQHSASQKRRRRGTTKSSARNVPEDLLGKDEAEELLKLVQGRVVCWAYDWLEKEDRGGNWLYNIDQLAPLEIYD